MKKLFPIILLGLTLFSSLAIAEVDKVTLANVDATTPPPPPEPDCCIYLMRVTDLPYPQSHITTIDVLNKGTGGQPFAKVGEINLPEGDICTGIQVDDNYIYCYGGGDPILSMYSKDSPYSLVDAVYYVEFGDPEASIFGFTISNDYIYISGYHTWPSAQGFFWILDKSDIHTISPVTVVTGPTGGVESIYNPLVIEDNFILDIEPPGGSSYDVVYLGDGSQCPSGGGYTGNGACWTSPTNCSFGGYSCENHDRGVWFGPGSSCAGTLPPNPFPTGACCKSDGTCSDTTASACVGYSGHHFGGNGTSCFENPCTTGACCNVDASCSVGTFEDCAINLGVYRGNGTTCTLPSGKGRLNSIALKTCYPPQGACVKPSVNSCSMMTLQQCYQQSIHPDAKFGPIQMWNSGGGWVGTVGSDHQIISGGPDCGDELIFGQVESFALGKYDKIEIPGIFSIGVLYLVGGGSSNGEFYIWNWDILFPIYPHRARVGGACTGNFPLKGNTWFDFDSNYIYILDAYDHHIKVLSKISSVFGDPEPMVDSYLYNAVAYPWEEIAVSK